MKNPIPLSALLQILDAEACQQIAEPLRRIATSEPYDAWFRVLDDCAPLPTNTALAAFQSYALLHSGRLATPSARAYHRARFWRCHRTCGLS